MILKFAHIQILRDTKFYGNRLTNIKVQAMFNATLDVTIE